MGGIGAYLLRICLCAIVCAVAYRLLGSKGAIGAVVKMVGGVFLLMCLLSPFADIRIDSLSGWTDAFREEASLVVFDGEKNAKDQLHAIILEKTQAYILDKAYRLHADLTVSVTLSQEELPVPTAVALSGSISPYAKSQLSSWLVSELGIPLEAQTWN